MSDDRLINEYMVLREDKQTALINVLALTTHNLAQAIKKIEELEKYNYATRLYYRQCNEWQKVENPKSFSPDKVKPKRKPLVALGEAKEE